MNKVIPTKKIVKKYKMYNKIVKNYNFILKYDIIKNDWR